MNTNTNNTEKMQDFEKNTMHNAETSTNNAAAQVVAKPSFWTRVKQFVSEEIEQTKRDYHRIRRFTAPIHRIARWISNLIGSAFNFCVKLSIILIALMMLSNFFSANPEVATAVSNFFEGVWDGICSVPEYFVNILKSVFAPFINLFS